MKKILFIITLAIMLASGCSRDYTPAAGASGEDIFKAACLECHQAIEGKKNIHYELSKEKRNVEFISKKVSSGSLKMPKFPNISGSHLSAVSQYVLDHSTEKLGQ